MHISSFINASIAPTPKKFLDGQLCKVFKARRASRGEWSSGASDVTDVNDNSAFSSTSSPVGSVVSQIWLKIPERESASCCLHSTSSSNDTKSVTASISGIVDQTISKLAGIQVTRSNFNVGTREKHNTKSEIRHSDEGEGRKKCKQPLLGLLVHRSRFSVHFLS